MSIAKVAQKINESTTNPLKPVIPTKSRNAQPYIEVSTKEYTGLFGLMKISAIAKKMKTHRRLLMIRTMKKPKSRLTSA